jgi:hypothetical protein
MSRLIVLTQPLFHSILRIHIFDSSGAAGPLRGYAVADAMVDGSVSVQLSPAQP